MRHELYEKIRQFKGFLFFSANKYVHGILKLQLLKVIVCSLPFGIIVISNNSIHLKKIWNFKLLLDAASYGVCWVRHIMETKAETLCYVNQFDGTNNVACCIGC